MIQAIETHYHGYRFRSRLEARWAVFWEHVHIPFLYEPEGFVFREEVGDEILDLGCYLPDFWLPEQGLWVEIKGREPTHHELYLARLLEENTKKEVLILAGDCYTGRYRVTNGDEMFWDWDEIPGICTQIAPCGKCSGLCVISVDGSAWREVGEHSCGDHERWPDDAQFLPAFHAARSARFGR